MNLTLHPIVSGRSLIRNSLVGFLAILLPVTADARDTLLWVSYPLPRKVVSTELSQDLAQLDSFASHGDLDKLIGT